jgi:hypothetical protein
MFVVESFLRLYISFSVSLSLSLSLSPSHTKPAQIEAQVHLEAMSILTRKEAGRNLHDIMVLVLFFFFCLKGSRMLSV